MKSPRGVQRCPSLLYRCARYVPSFFPPPLLAAFLRPAVINISRERRLVRLGSIAPLMFRHAWLPCQPTLPTHPTLGIGGAGGGFEEPLWRNQGREEVGGLEKGLESRNFVLILSNSPPPSLPPLLQEPCFGRRQHPRKWMNALFV